VDYSNLNNEKQDLEANGESGQTFRGMLSWVTNHRPPVVILENVCSAPWERICEQFKKKGYSAASMRVDTKQYYIPHTRTRGYLVAVDAKHSKIPEEWKQKIKDLQRPASVTLDAFLLSSDDPRIHHAREKMVQEAKAALDKRREKIDWARCENRHQRARAEENLGNKRPLTSWTEGGTCKLLDHMWSDWGSVQVERVWDLMDITTLRRAVLGVDPSYKTSVYLISY
jgi:site-specific DNA-cytosine methylase